MGFAHQIVEIGLGAILWIHLGIISDIIAVIAHCRMDGRKPKGTDSQTLQIVHLGGDAIEVAYAITIAIGKAIYQQLIGYICTLLSIPSIGLRCHSRPFHRRSRRRCWSGCGGRRRFWSRTIIASTRSEYAKRNQTCQKYSYQSIGFHDSIIIDEFINMSSLKKGHAPS